MRFNNTSAAALAVAALLAVPAATRAADTVGAIRFDNQGNIPVDETYLRSFLALREGAAFTQKDAISDVRSLLDSARFSYVNSAVDRNADGKVDVTFTIVARPRLAGAVVFRGVSGLTESRCNKSVNLKPGDYVDDQVAQAGAERLRAYYVSRRYFDAKVTPTLTAAGDIEGAAILTYTIEEGLHYKVNFLQFPGATAIEADKLGETAQIHNWYNPLSWVNWPHVTDADFDNVRADARRQYLEAGYLDATVGEAKKTLDGTVLTVEFPVAEGVQYTYGSLAIEGATLYSTETLAKLAGIKEGMVAGTKTLESAREAVSDYYSNHGYPDTYVDVSTSVKKEGVLDVTFRIQEGKLVHVRSVLVRGNTISKDKVIRREIGVAPGDPYDTVQIERSKNRLMNLGYFSDVRTYATPVSEGVRDLNVEVDEKSTGMFSIGAGFSSVDRLVGMFSISQSNFDIFNWPTMKGAGQKARLDVTVGSDTMDLDASLIEPWFLDRRLALELDVFVNERGYDEYDETRAGATIGLSKQVPWVGRVGISYTLQQISIDDQIDKQFTSVDGSKFYDRNGNGTFSYKDDLDDSYMLGSIKASWTYDTRDNMIVPTRGTRMTAALSLFHEAIGSDYNMYEASFRANRYWTLPWGTLFTLGGRASTIDGIGSGEKAQVPISQRYFLGGGRYARGWKHRQIGPKVHESSYGYAPIGGQTILHGTAEWSVPLVDRIRFATFADFGYIGSDAWELSSDGLAVSVGAGLRFDFVGFPVRLDYAKAIHDPDDYAEKRSFVFWIGFD